jgi:hypothetical protein
LTLPFKSLCLFMKRVSCKFRSFRLVNSYLCVRQNVAAVSVPPKTRWRTKMPIQFLSKERLRSPSFLFILFLYSSMFREKRRDALLSEIYVLLGSKMALFSSYVLQSLSAANGNTIKFGVNKISVVSWSSMMAVCTWILIVYLSGVG